LLSGDTEQARKALEAFSKEFPKSMFLPTLREAMP